MALELLQELESGVSGNYWRIGSVVVACTDDPIVTIYMELYVNQAARHSGKSPLKTQAVNMMLYQIDSTYDYDFRACIYNSIKQLPYWENARDIFEFNEKYDVSPVANYVDITCDMNSTEIVTFNAQDLDNLPLTYTIVDQPSNGTISQSNGVFTYTPNQGWQGNDVASYRANNGTNFSNLAKLYFNVPQVKPIVNDMAFTGEFNGSTVLNLTGSDPNNLPLTFIITQQPSNGSISVVNNVVTYSPNLNWSGSDTAKFKANNGNYDSDEANIELNVISAVPTVSNFNLLGGFNTPKTFELEGIDPNNLALTFSITSQPANGNITFNNGVFTFTPDNNWGGSDIAKFKANNGTYDSNIADINITVNYPVPNVYSNTILMNQNELVSFELTGSDPSNLPLTFTVTEGPLNGTLTLVSGNSYTYKPSNDFIGQDLISFKANNGFEDSAIANIVFEVQEIV